MPIYRDRIYPRLASSVGNPKPIRSLRRGLVPLAAGTVLEIGVGAGANLPFYDPERVTLLYALEPNPGMRRLAATEQRQVGLKVEFIDLPGERLPLEDASVDTVVSTFTLCTIANLTDALRGIKRVLRPGGRVSVSRAERCLGSACASLAAPVGAHSPQTVRRALLDSGYSSDSATGGLSITGG
jgi:ubiquinone/menaquinone biosynthesis C-methylase UbiE